MAAKYQLMTELYRRTGNEVTRNTQVWQNFLASACHNYKCRFDEQLLIYAQRPDATAVAEISTWNRLFNRWVNRNSKAIAVFDTKGKRNTLKYYFDVSDTHAGYYNSLPVPIWQMSRRYEQPVIERLSNRFGETKSRDLASVLMETSGNAVEDNLPDYLAQLKENMKDSYLQGLDDLNIGVIYRQLATKSVAFMLFRRCGLETDDYFDKEEFAEIVNFNTPATLNAIGIVTSDISEMALREISQAIRDVQIEAKKQNRTFARSLPNQYDTGKTGKERSKDNERNHIQQTGGLPYSRPHISDRTRTSPWQICFDAQGLSGELQKSDISQPVDNRKTERTPIRSGTDSTQPIREDDKTDGGSTGRDRRTERKSPGTVDTDNEYNPQPSGGSDTERTDLQLTSQESEPQARDEPQPGGELGVQLNTLEPLPTVEEQIEKIVEAEEQKTSAFSVSQEDIDSVLVRGSGVAGSKYRIYSQFKKQENSKENITFLKQEYGIGEGSHHFPDGNKGRSWYSSKGIAIVRKDTCTEHDILLSWSKVEKRLRELIKADRYLNPKEKDHYADYLESISAPQYEIDTQKMLKRRRFIQEMSDIPPADKRNTLSRRLSDFIHDMEGYEKNMLAEVGRTDLSDVTHDQMERRLCEPATVQQLIDFLLLVQKGTGDVYSRSNAWRFREELKELFPYRYLCHEGDTVYIGADKYQIITLSEDIVYLQNAQFPILSQTYSREDFEQKLRENPVNDYFRIVITETSELYAPAEKQQNSIHFSIGFSEHPAFYDKKLNGRFKDLNFALGNKLLGILDKKQCKDRLDESKGTGWYQKTDFEISAVIDGREFYYEGRFDIGDGEGDLIAHIKNYYKYYLSPDCPSVSEWKYQGEDYYREQMESLYRGQNIFVPFLEKHTELTIEDKKLLNEIMDTESDWYRKGNAKVSEPLSDQTMADKDRFEKSVISKEDVQDKLGLPADPRSFSYKRRNYTITNEELGVGGMKEKFRNNLAAIRLIQKLQADNRLATPQEQEILSRYVGWGGLSMVFDKHNAAWTKEYRELKSILTEKEYQAAMESTLTAFYTPPVVIKAMYEALGKLGFSKGRILEPSCGVGGFFGFLPPDMADSKLHGVEIDLLSGKIAKQLYQKANISIEGFEDTKIPDDYFDVILGNVPFGEFKINDSRYNAHKFLIHDYFFAKALDKVRSGGVVMFLTSKGTMDKVNPKVRKYIAQRAELLGSVRLPDNTFKANAGTEVTSDILILQKRDQIIEIEPDWIHLDTDENGITMNRYFVEHPEMVLGEMKTINTRFGMETTVCKARQDKPLSELLHEAMQQINGKITEVDNEIDRISDEQDTSIDAAPNVRNFSYALADGKIYFRENDKMYPAKMSITAENRIRGLLEIRDCVRSLIQYQADDCPEEMIQSEQKKLNRLYDNFTAKYGLINSRGNYLAFAADESYFLLCSLEVLDSEGKFKKKADMFTKRTIKPQREVMFVETASEALALSIGEKAHVDLAYMATLTRKTQEEIIRNLEGVIFKIPNSEPVKYVTADEYLSGNVRKKLAIAKAAAQESREYEVNAAALQKVIPKDLSASEISVRLGTAWIPEADIKQFIMELLVPSSYAEKKLRVCYTSITGEWFIENKKSDFPNIKAVSTYGTNRASAYRLIEDALNLRDTRIFDCTYDKSGNKKVELNVKETTTAQAKQEIIKQKFQEWIWKDPKRRNRLVRYYNDTFNSIRPRQYDGKHITFGGISPEITLRPHQVNAIAHILYGGNTLLAHKVGAGKTFEMVAAAQESKRLGLCHKSMFVVPNHLVGQWASEYLRLYPSANILVTRKQDFEKANRKKFCGRIATGEYDAIIIGQSLFEKIPISEERQKQQLLSQIEDIQQGIDEIQKSHGEQFTVKQLMKMKKSIEVKLEKLNNTKRKDHVINFEELGIDRLFIDESHFYKNLYFYTKMRNVGGIAQTEAQKSSDLFLKCRYLDEITGSRGTIFATGTPISNSMVELYSIQRYLQYDTLVKNGLQQFDSWASVFGETTMALELSPEGTSYRAKTRFAKFHNLPELMQMFREVEDIQTADMLKLPVPKVNYHNIKTKPSEIQVEMVKRLAKRAENVRARRVAPYKDNMLRITNDGRRLALDQRLIDPMLPDDPDSKVNACVENIYHIWETHTDTKAAQLVFSDLSTPTNKKVIDMQEIKEDVFEMIPDQFNNVYDDMRKKLIQRGIPSEQVRFIHEASTDAQKKELFAKVRSGEVRVLFGSTQKMGAGTNCQDRLIAIHNLDCPWKPSALEQRQGRLERQGNMFSEVEVYRYVTERTFDAYLYQLVEGKQRFVSQIMTSKSPVRSAEDVDEAALSFAEVKMLATGDERFKEKMDLDMQVSKLRVLKQSYLSERYDLEDKIVKHYPEEIKRYEELIYGYGKDIELVEKNMPKGEDGFSPMTINGKTYKDKAHAREILLAVYKQNLSLQIVEIGNYRGFRMEVFYDIQEAKGYLNLCGTRKYRVELKSDASGNLTRIDNEIGRLPAKYEAAKREKAEMIVQLEIAKEEVKKPFAFEEELKEKTERLNILNIELNLNEKDKSVIDTEIEDGGEMAERKKVNKERL